MRGRLYHIDDDWYEWRQTPSLAAAVHVRVVPGAGGRLHLAELRVLGEPTSELLRSIPVGRIEAAANAQLTMVDERIRPRDHVARRRSARRVDPSPDGSEAGWEPPRRSDRPHTARSRGRPDRFYADIAEAYQRLAQSSPRPAVDLAARNDVPVTTAHRWIKEARRRGYLAPGRPGKAG